MITQLKIENYKSIQDLTLDVGRVNVLIGENGCGKSNILEAITFAAAAEADRLAKEFLLNRGIRVTEPQLMRSIFKKSLTSKNDIKITINFIENKEYKGYKNYTLKNDNTPYSEWTHVEKNTIKNIADNIQKENLTQFEDERKKFSMKSLSEIKSYINELAENPDEYSNQERLFIGFLGLQGILNNPIKIKDFIIYSPENTVLRNFKEVSAIEPLGDKGEGLLKLLTVIQHEAQDSEIDKEAFNDIQETLELFDWYESVEVPSELSPLERKITIQDRYLEMPFDQRSANEGFLLVLFYITLVVSKYTPKIFAIDNIDTSLNPKLCTKLIKELTRLAKKYDKQIFLTSHNPAILDGIDLADEEQRLIVVYRDDDGRTCCDRLSLEDKPKSATKARLLRLFKDNPIICQKIEETFNNSEEPLKLSEAFLRGYLGGLPTGF